MQTINLNATVTTGTLRWADTNATGAVASFGIAAGTGGALNMATAAGSTPTILFTGTAQNQQFLISAPITGTQGLRIGKENTAGIGQINLTGTSTFTGNITIDAVSNNYLNLVDTGRLGSTGTFAGDISIGTGAFFRPWHSGLQTLSGNISGNGAFQLLGATYNTGTLALTGSNAFTGTINVNASAGTSLQGKVLLLGNADAMRNAILATSTSALENAGTRTVQFATGIGTFNLGGITAGNLGTGNIGLTDTANSAITLAVGHNNLASSYSGTFFGAGNLTKVGSGTLTLSAVNTYTGTTTVNNGTLWLGSAAATGIIRGPLVINAGGTVSSGTWSFGYAGGNVVSSITINGGVLDLRSNQLGSSPITMTGGAIQGSQAADVYATSDTIAASITTLASSTTATISAGLALRLNGKDSNQLLFGVASGSAPNGVDLLVSGPITKSAGGLSGGGIAKSGAGRMRLTAANTYTGTTSVNAGILEIGDGSTTG
ncbi:MAG: autotransporter-associated beta strand repeat-containing protein, partial [Planctomycetia bacterium]